MISICLLAIVAIGPCVASDTAYATKVKALIDAGTCNSVTTNSTVCGSSTIPYSYYETFIYGDYRVVIVSGVPDHAAEYNQTKSTPNTRCLRYQYMITPSSPSTLADSGVTETVMGVMALVSSGVPIYNPLSSSNGSLASYYEWTTLDPCYGHTDQDYQYHYHAISSCISGATTPSSNVQLGYFIDGYPIYGYSENSAGTTLKSCWYSTSSSPSLISEFTYDTTGYSNGTCHLDKANGYTFTSGYGYVMVSTNYYAPYYYSGTEKGSVCGFTP